MKSISRRDFGKRAAMATGVLAASSELDAAQAADLKIGLYSITYLGAWYRGPALSLEEVVDRAKQFGYAGVEVDGKRPHGDPLDMPAKRCKELRKYAQDHGIEIYAVAANNDFSSPVPEAREAQLAYMRELVRMTSDLGAKHLRVFLAWPGITIAPDGIARYETSKAIWEAAHRDFKEEQTWAWCRAGMQEAARYAREAGIVLALQNHPPVIKSYKDVLRMVKEVDSPNLKVCFDARIEHDATAEQIMAATREVGPLQVLSHYGSEYDEVNGRPVVKHDEFAPAQVRSLIDIGYRGYLGFEFCHPVPMVNGQPAGIEYIDKNAKLAAQYMKDTIAQASRRT
jgi:sugar phosphate isomerase/epimerase